MMSARFFRIVIFFSAILLMSSLMLFKGYADSEDTIDIGDGSSSFITTKAWEMYNKKDYQSALAYAEKCIELYESEAITQQESLVRYPEKKDISKYWALNDAGTCYYIAGLASLETGKNEQAQDYFTFVAESLSYASCWDPKGWYWKVGLEARKELQKLR
ncbi:MAG: hypothetical protein Q8O12_00790 [Candidatus Omnitrophota bacterium]|nr:hypothetical protein [Candidatus Omnitrophota bacterium]